MIPQKSYSLGSLSLVGDTGWGVDVQIHSVTLICHSDLTFKIFSGLYPGNNKGQDVDTCLGHWLSGSGEQCHG